MTDCLRRVGAGVGRAVEIGPGFVVLLVFLKVGPRGKAGFLGLAQCLSSLKCCLCVLQGAVRGSGKAAAEAVLSMPVGEVLPPPPRRPAARCCFWFRCPPSAAASLAAAPSPTANSRPLLPPPLLPPFAPRRGRGCLSLPLTFHWPFTGPPLPSSTAFPLAVHCLLSLPPMDRSLH